MPDMNLMQKVNNLAQKYGSKVKEIHMPSYHITMSPRLALTASLVAIILASSVRADDFNPPEWRGEYYSLKVVYEFNEEPINIRNVSPDSFAWGKDFAPHNNPPYQPTDLFFDDRSYEWRDGKIYKTGIGNSVLFIDNFPGGAYKDIRIQIHFGNDNPKDNPITIGSIEGTDRPGNSYTEIKVGGGVFEIDGKKDYTKIWEDWKITPNPSTENISFSIPVGSYIDQIVIDTRCVPEPATVILLGLGAIALRKRKYVDSKVVQK